MIYDDDKLTRNTDIVTMFICLLFIMTIAGGNLSSGLFNYFIILLDTVAGIGILLYLFFVKHNRKLPFWHRKWLWIGAFGLLGQSYRSLTFLLTGESPTDNEIPFWVLKDIGLAGLVWEYVVRLTIKKLKLK